MGFGLLMAAFILSLIAAFVPRPAIPPATGWVWRFPHFGWLALSLYFLSLLVGGGR